MARRVRFGVTLPQIKRTWADARAAAVEFDRLGYDSVWVCDHLYGVPMPTLPILEAWRELAGVASGWFATEFEAHGIPFPPIRERLQALEETIDVMTRMWTEPSVT